MTMQIRVTGLKEVQSFMKNLSPNIQTAVRDKGIPFITKDLQKRIKRSFKSVGYGKGVSSSGASVRSIRYRRYRKTPKGAVVEINAPWLVMIEKGLTRSHWVSRYTIKQHLKHPGSTILQKAPEGAYGGNPVWWKYRGKFISPALHRFRPTIVPKLMKFVRDGIKKS